MTFAAAVVRDQMPDEGMSHAQARLVSHGPDIDVPLIAPWNTSREFLFGTPIIIGDPTLRLRP